MGLAEQLLSVCPLPTRLVTGDFDAVITCKPLPGSA
jgi:hypothetical protein